MDVVQRYYVSLMAVNLIIMIHDTWAKKDLNVDANKRPALWVIGLVFNIPIIGRVFGEW